MLLFQYLDKLPPIPESLLAQVVDLSKTDPMWTAQARTMKTNDKPVNNLLYTRWDLSPQLTTWIENNISPKIDQLGFQMSSPANDSSTHLCHTDSFPRRWVLNYVVDTGGSDVHTNFYFEPGHSLIRGHLERPLDMTVMHKIYSVKVQPYRWHILNALVMHDVTDIQSPRKAISAGIALENPFDAIPAYTGTLSL